VKIANGVIRDAVHRLYQGVPYTQNVTFSWYTCGSNIMYAYKNSVAFSAHIFMTLTNAGQHYAHSSYTEFHPNHAVNVEHMGKDSLSP
jgi:hypothetical protein